ncbi:MAG: hypothetical protein EP343_13900 [Deltaproteobacteria bacterium]|nr:MAG: hypothetical protein EP343_13900 [Deltaproteobacteria bacterium]
MYAARLAFYFRRIFLITGLASFTLFLMACPEPKWPSCKDDKNCRSDKKDNPVSVAYFCINGSCVQCRNVKDCPDPTKQKCVNNACVAKTCGDITCPGGKECDPTTLGCKYPCENDGDSPCKGDSCKVCRNHQCVPKPPKCTKNGDCPANQICQNAGDSCNARCEGGCAADKPCPAGQECRNGQCAQATCQAETIYFDFNKYFIRSDARSGLQRNAECVKKMVGYGKKVLIEGHCDERGTREYNLWLGRRRASTTKKYLVQLGVDSGKVCTVSKGKEDPVVTNATDGDGHQKNRRAVFKFVDSCP